ncbi:MAG: choice-of-anchor B family protein [Bacteroidia bacterium]
MKKIFVTLLLLLTSNFLLLTSNAQDSLNMTKLGHLPYSAQLSNIWGYATEGKEYALVGTDNGMSIVDVTDPANPDEVYFKAGANSIWREIKVFNDHAYITTEGGGGLQIVDMTPLPQNTNLSSVSYFGNQYDFTTAHTLYIDENGILYIFGSDYGQGGAIIYDLNANPEAPVELGVFDDYYIHDGFVRGDTLWASCVYDGFLSIVDVSDKANPTAVTTFNTPSNFTHNSWPTNNNNFLFTTDEVSNAYVASYDVSDFNDITEVDRFQHYPGSGSIPHNAHLLGNFLYVSYYKDGVVVIDVTNPDNLVESGFYDTAPTMSGDGFNGCWGVYPYLPSGNIIASDMASGLWILGFNNTQACFLEGVVTDFSNGNTLNGVTVEILTTSGLTATNLVGEYATGFANANTYSVQFSKGGYITQIIDNIVLTSGNTTTLDVALVPDIPFVFTGQVVDAETGSGIPNAAVRVYNNSFTHNLTADANGVFTVSTFYAGLYEIVAGKWGHITTCADFTITSTSGTAVVELEKGIYDDFSFNFGWTETNTSPTGQWERGVPAGTSYNNSVSNADRDVSNDCLDLAFVTGNDGGGAGDDDVDDGNVTLLSPDFDLSTYTDPYLYYSRWFFNGGGNGGNPNDSMIIELSNGQDVVVIDRTTAAETMSEWINRSFRISDYLTPTSDMSVKVIAYDVTPGHLVEGGFDKFYVEDIMQPGFEENQTAVISVYPNPANNTITINCRTQVANSELQITNLSGQLVQQSTINNSQSTIDISALSKGIYIIKINDSKGQTLHVEKLVKN